MSDQVIHYTRIDGSKGEVKKGEANLPKGVAAIDYLTDTIAESYNDGWRKGGWDVTRNRDGSTTLKSGKVVYVFFTRNKKDSLTKRAYHTDHVDRFLYHCMKVLQIDEMPDPETLTVDSMIKTFDDLPIPFSVSLEKSDNEPIVSVIVGGEVFSLERADELLVGLRRIIAIVRKMQKKKDRLGL